MALGYQIGTIMRRKTTLYEGQLAGSLTVKVDEIENFPRHIQVRIERMSAPDSALFNRTGMAFMTPGT